MASSGAMMAQMFSYIIPQSVVMVIAPCKKETRSNSKLCKGRKAPKRPASQRQVAEAAVSNHLAGRVAPPAGLFLFKVHPGERALRQWGAFGFAGSAR